MPKDVVFVHSGGEVCTPYRMNRGVEIYRSGGLKLAISKGLMQLALQSLVPESDILPMPSARSTIEELYFLRERILKPNDLGGGYLVSCEKHGQRIREIATQELKRYDWEFVPAENHECEITLGIETLARQLDRLVLLLCRVYDRPDIYQTLKEIGPKWVYNQTRRLFLRK